jgi:ElaB/YqjD/DUF883 family membrane-anchored ribosome-binding protein
MRERVGEPASMNDLVAEAEEMLGKLKGATSPEIQRLRDKVRASVEDMKGTLADRTRTSAAQIRAATESVVEYVQANPWVAVAAGTAIAVALLYVAFSGRDDRD